MDLGLRGRRGDRGCGKQGTGPGGCRRVGPRRREVAICSRNAAELEKAAQIRRGDDSRHEPDIQRGPQSLDKKRNHVDAQMVGSQPMFARRRHQGGAYRMYVDGVKERKQKRDGQGKQEQENADKKVRRFQEIQENFHGLFRSLSGFDPGIQKPNENIDGKIGRKHADGDKQRAPLNERIVITLNCRQHGHAEARIRKNHFRYESPSDHHAQRQRQTGQLRQHGIAKHVKKHLGFGNAQATWRI